MRFQFTSALLMLFTFALPSHADQFGNVPGNSGTLPREVGTTSMHPGNYVLTEQNSGRTYSLLVTEKGSMVLDAQPGQNKDKKQMLEKGMEHGAMDLFKSGALKGL